MRRRVGAYKPTKNCLGCDRPDTFGVAMRPTVKEVQGEDFTFDTEKYHCTACEAEWLSPAQMFSAVRQAVTFYLKKHMMLTGEECEQRRRKIGWTQEDLVKTSGVSIATIKRLESGVHILTQPNNDALEKALENAQHHWAPANAPALSWMQMEANWVATANWSIESDPQATESTADVSESMALAADSNQLALAA